MGGGKGKKLWGGVIFLHNLQKRKEKGWKGKSEGEKKHLGGAAGNQGEDLKTGEKIRTRGVGKAGLSRNGGRKGEAEGAGIRSN